MPQAPVTRGDPPTTEARTMPSTFALDDDMLDVRDIIARVEELRNMEAHDDEGELMRLEELLGDIKGNGGDEQWEGDWYPLTLVRDSYFKEYAQDLAEDCGLLVTEAQWPNNCIDWDRAARELRMDYTCTEFGGVTFWYR